MTTEPRVYCEVTYDGYTLSVIISFYVNRICLQNFLYYLDSIVGMMVLVLSLSYES